MNRIDRIAADVPAKLAMLVAHWTTMQVKLADKALRQEAQCTPKPADAVPQLAWAASVDGRFLYCNSDLRALLGDCRNRLVESVMPEALSHAVDRERWLSAWRGALQSGQAYEVEYQVRFGGDNSDHWYIERGMPRDSAGTAERWFVTATRIDQQKRRKEDLRALLEREEQFLAALLHELHSPLLPIANALDLLASRSDDPKIVIGARGVIQLQLRQLTRLVDDLLDAVMLARGAIELHSKQADVADVIAAAARIAHPVIERRGEWSRVRARIRPTLRRLDPGE